MTANKEFEGKSRWSLIPFNSLEELLKVYEFGSKKYEDNNWKKGLKYSKIFDALQRHIVNEWWNNAANKDYESELHPLAHAAFWCLMVIHMEQNKEKYVSFDDRHMYCGKEEVVEEMRRILDGIAQEIDKKFTNENIKNPNDNITYISEEEKKPKNTKKIHELMNEFEWTQELNPKEYYKLADYITGFLSIWDAWAFLENEQVKIDMNKNEMDKKIKR